MFFNVLTNCRYNLIVKCFNSPTGSYFGPEWQLVVDMLTRYLAVINSSINFVIYCVAGKQFRRVLAILLHLRSGRSVHNLAAVNMHHKEKIKIAQCLSQGLFAITRATGCLPDVLVTGEATVVQNRKTDITFELEHSSPKSESIVGTKHKLVVNSTLDLELTSVDV